MNVMKRRDLMFEQLRRTKNMRTSRLFDSPGKCQWCGAEWEAGMFNRNRRYCSEACQRHSPKMLKTERRKPIPRRKQVVRELTQNQNGRCGICGSALDGPVHVDHIVPLSRGGPHVLSNWQAVHPECNLTKGARIL